MREHSYGYQLGVNVIGSPYGNNNESPSTTRRRDVDVSFYPSYLGIVIAHNYLPRALPVTFVVSHSYFMSVLHDCLSGVVGR